MSGLFKGETKTYVVSSPLKGTLMKDGVPLANTKIIRRLTWNTNEEGIEQVFQTDENGFFDLPTHEEAFAMSPLLEFVAHTDLYAIVGGERDKFWFMAKRSPELNSEWAELPRDIICEINMDINTVHIEHGLCGAKCTWLNMPKEDKNPYGP